MPLAAPPSASAPASARQMAERLVGPHFGLIEELQAVAPEADDIPLAVHTGYLANTWALGGPCSGQNALVDWGESQRVHSGAALDAERSLWACLGEGLERYAAALPGPQGIVPALLHELDAPPIVPDCFALFSRRQYAQTGGAFPFVRWQASARIGWTSAQCAASGKRVWLPAALVWQPYWQPEEIVWTPSLSTGLACGPTLEAAQVSGVCEVVERDAVALAWLGRVHPPRVDFSGGSMPADLSQLLDHYRRLGLRWSAFDLTTEFGLPVVAVLTEGHSPLGPIVSFGSACKPTFEEAATKALVEAAHARMYVKSLLRNEPDVNPAFRPSRVRSFADHARFYSRNPARGQALCRWWFSQRSVSWETLCMKSASGEPLGFDPIARLLKRHGYEVYWVNITPPDVASLGLFVVRVLAPGLQPLHGVHDWPHLGGARLKRLGSIFGFPARQPWTYNRWPHPAAKCTA